jgi:hypothetical protein
MAGDSKNWNAKVITLKQETTEGTDSTPTPTADAIRVLNYQPNFVDADQKTRALEKAYFGADPVYMAAAKRGATFSMEVAGGGAAGGTTVPPWMKVLQFCGFAAPVVGASSVTQNPTTANTASATHYAWLDDLLIRSVGVRGSVGFTFEDDEFPRFDFTLLGKALQSNLSNQQVPATPTLTGYIDPVLASTENTSILYGGFAYPVRRWTMSDNAELVFRSLINPVDRVLYAGRRWAGELVLELGDISANNPFDNFRSGATKVGKVVHSGGAGNIVQVDMPALQISGNPSISEEQGKIMATLPVTALPVSGNDEIVFTTK